MRSSSSHHRHPQEDETAASTRDGEGASTPASLRNDEDDVAIIAAVRSCSCCCCNSLILLRHSSIRDAGSNATESSQMSPYVRVSPNQFWPPHVKHNTARDLRKMAREGEGKEKQLTNCAMLIITQILTFPIYRATQAPKARANKGHGVAKPGPWVAFYYLATLHTNK